MKTAMTAIVIVAVMMTVTSDRAYTAPKPTPLPTKWEFDFKFEPPQPIKVYLMGRAEPKLFWYLRYTITNNTPNDQIFTPEFTLYPDTGKLLVATAPIEVFKAIKKHHNDPLLKRDTAGRILRGADNAKKGVAIWPDFDPEAGAFDIFVGGLSGEIVVVELPKPVVVTVIDPEGGTRKVKKNSLELSKTLRIGCNVPGEAAARIRVRVKVTSRTWVMR